LYQKLHIRLLRAGKFCRVAGIEAKIWVWARSHLVGKSAKIPIDPPVLKHTPAKKLLSLHD
jgi:hypothetical protein